MVDIRATYNEEIGCIAEPRAIFLDSDLGFDEKWYIRFPVYNLDYYLQYRTNSERRKNVIAIVYVSQLSIFPGAIPRVSSS